MNETVPVIFGDHQLVIVGATGAGREILRYAQDLNLPIKGIIDEDNKAEDAKAVESITGTALVGSVSSYRPQANDRFLITEGDPELRETISSQLRSRGAQFYTLIHPKAYVAPTARIGVGCIVCPFATIGSFSELNNNVLIGLYGLIGHDARVGSSSVFSSYAIANGGCSVGSRVYLGNHTVLLPQISVGAGAKVSPGAVVYRDVPAYSVVAGNPAHLRQMTEARANRKT